MAVTGTGTSSDPFVVSTWQELVDTVKVSTIPSKTYVKFKEGTVINLDDYYTEYAPEVVVYGHRTCYIDFNRAVIINGRFNKMLSSGNDGASYPLYIRNAIILNARVDSTTGICNDGSDSHIYFEDCVLDIHLLLSDASFTGRGLNKFSRCKVTVNGNGYWSTSSNTEYSDCIVDIQLNTHTASNAGVTYTPFAEEPVTVDNHAGLINGLGNKAFPVCRDCHIIGKLDSAEGVDSKTMLWLIPYNCTIEIDCDIVTPYTGGAVLCNSDKATLASSATVGSNTATAKGPLYKRTPEEIRNPQVLYDIGFSVNPNSIAN